MIFLGFMMVCFGFLQIYTSKLRWWISTQFFNLLRSYFHRYKALIIISIHSVLTWNFIWLWCVIDIFTKDVSVLVLYMRRLIKVMWWASCLVWVYSSFVCECDDTFCFFFLVEIDARILRTVAREHPTDADEAAAVVISEVVPLFPQEWEDHVRKRILHHLPLCKGTLLSLTLLTIIIYTSQARGYLPLIGWIVVWNAVEPETQHDDDALSQWLHPSHLPQSYLALLNEEEEEKATPDLKPLLDYAVKKVVLPSRDAATGARREVRTIYSASNKTASSVVKPSIRVQSQTNNEQLSVSVSITSFFCFFFIIYS